MCAEQLKAARHHGGTKSVPTILQGAAKEDVLQEARTKKLCAGGTKDLVPTNRIPRSSSTHKTDR